MADARLNTVKLDDLLRRAGEQSTMLQDLRLRSAAMAILNEPSAA
jgi:hypothetical protein